MNVLRRLLRLNPQRYYTLGRGYWRRLKFYNPEKLTPRYRAAVQHYPNHVLVSAQIDIATTPYFNEALMAHVKRHLPSWPGFKTEYLTYVEREWNSIYGDWDWNAMKVVIREQPLLQRDRLMQIFEACPPGSYGYYAKSGLRPFRAVVGSFASATIDQFFASQVQFLKQPFSVPINEIMSTLETRYWNSRQELLDYIAGKTFTKRRRQLGVSIPAKLMTIWEGQRKPELPEGEALESEQLEEVQSVLTDENLDNLDEVALARFTSELYDRLVREGKAKADSSHAFDE